MRNDAFSEATAPSAVSDLGNEALYCDFENAKGSAIVVSSRLTLLGLGGIQTKEAIVGLARSAACRL